jgi:hypothetical protein
VDGCQFHRHHRAPLQQASWAAHPAVMHLVPFPHSYWLGFSPPPASGSAPLLLAALTVLLLLLLPELLLELLLLLTPCLVRMWRSRLRALGPTAAPHMPHTRGGGLLRRAALAAQAGARLCAAWRAASRSMRADMNPALGLAPGRTRLEVVLVRRWGRTRVTGVLAACQACEEGRLLWVAWTVGW